MTLLASNLMPAFTAFQANELVRIFGDGFGFQAYVEKTGNYTVTLSDQVINFTTGSATCSLVTAVEVGGRGYTIKNSSSGGVTVVPFGSETIDGQPLVFLSQWDSATLFSTGANWILI